MARSIPLRPTRARPPSRAVVGWILVVLVVVVALGTGALREVVVHAFAWPALSGGWLAEQIGSGPGSLLHTVLPWVFELPWLGWLGWVSASIARQGWQEHGAARELRAYLERHGDELAELQARVDEAPDVLDALEEEAARIRATLEALGADAWAAGAVVTRTPARLVVEAPAEAAEGAVLRSDGDGDVQVRAADISFHDGPTWVQWTHELVRRHREPTRLLLGATGGAGVNGVPCGVEASPLALDHLEVVLDLGAGTVDTFTARQRLAALVRRSEEEVERVLDRGEADLARLAQLEALRPGAEDAAAPGADPGAAPGGVPGAEEAFAVGAAAASGLAHDRSADPFAAPVNVPTVPPVVWGHGAEKAARPCWEDVESLLAEGERVEYVVRVRRRRPALDLVVVTDRRVLGLERARVADSGAVLAVAREAVDAVGVSGLMQVLSLRLRDGEVVTLGALGHSSDEVPARYHLRRPEVLA